MADLANSTGGGSVSSFSSSISTTLLQLVRRRDEQAWQRLVAIYEPTVYSWCRSFGVSAGDAPEVVQEVFLSLWKHITTFRRDRPGDSFRGWLRTVAQSRALDYLRRRGRQAPGVGGTAIYEQLLGISEPISTSSIDPRTEMTALLHRALAQIRGEFEPHNWTAFWRATLTGDSAADIGRDLGMTKSAVRQAKYRVLRRLRQEIDGLCE